MIDRDETRYTPELLREWKRVAEERARSELGAALYADEDVRAQITTAFTGRASDLAPAAISNVHHAAQQALEELDPRFQIRSEYIDGAAHVTLSAREPVDITTNVVGASAFAWTEGLHALIEYGRPAVLPMSGVSFEGSKLLEGIGEQAQRGALTITPIGKPAAMTISASDGGHGWQAFSERIDGVATPGRTSVRFEGGGVGGLLRLEVDIMRDAARRVGSRLLMHISFAPWAGVDVRMTPYLDAVLNVLRAIVEQTDRLRIAMHIEGNQVLRGVNPSLNGAEQFSAHLTFASYVERSRTVARGLDVEIPIDLDVEFSADEHAALAEVAEILGGARRLRDCDVEGPVAFTLLSDGGGEEIRRIIGSQEDHSVMVAMPPQPLRVFGKELQLPSKKMILERAVLRVEEEARRDDGRTELRLVADLCPGSHVIFTYDHFPPDSDGVGAAEIDGA